MNQIRISFITLILLFTFLGIQVSGYESDVLTIELNTPEPYIGDTVSFSGICNAENVYLSVTGPNLPENGVSPEDLYEEKEIEGFIEIPVKDGSWEYNWDTLMVKSGILPEEKYKMRVLTAPLNLNSPAGSYGVSAEKEFFFRNPETEPEKQDSGLPPFTALIGIGLCIVIFAFRDRL